MPKVDAVNSVSPNRAIALALLVMFAGCIGASPDDVGASDPTTELPTSTTELPTSTTQQPTDETTTDGATTDQTTEPHTGVGTSHSSNHFTVRAGAEAQNVTVTLAPNGDSDTYPLDAGTQRDLTREIHDRGHDVRVVVERGSETVFDQTIYGYESVDLTVDENDTRVSQAEV